MALENSELLFLNNFDNLPSSSYATHVMSPDPLRFSDFVHTEAALLAQAEKICAFARIPAQAVSKEPFGLVICQTSALRRWIGPEPLNRSCLVDIAVLDQFGVHALWSQHVGELLPAGAYVALVPWWQVDRGAWHLRRLVGPVIKNVARQLYVEQTIEKFQLPERALNDTALPSWAKVRSGTCLRLDAAAAQGIIPFFNLELTPGPAAEDTNCGFYLTYVMREDSTEAVRLIVTDRWDLSAAHRELVRRPLQGRRRRSKL